MASPEAAEAKKCDWRKPCVRRGPRLLQLTSKFFLLNLDNMFAWHNHQSQIAMDQVHLDRAFPSGFALGGGLGALCGGGLAVFVGVLEDNVAVLGESWTSGPGPH